MGKRILFGVLNWGLGHASRSSMLIHEMLNQGFEPVLASDGVALEYLRREFPLLESRELPPYEIKYSKGNNQWPNLIAALPKMAKTAAKERALVDLWVAEDGFDGVLSDNRLGFYSSLVRSVYLSHQLAPQAGILTTLAQKMHAQFYSKYQEIWIPDTPLATLSGSLSKARVTNKRYIGPLSALQQTEAKEASKILVVLSGPEPQRTLLEKRIFTQAEGLPEDIVLVRGTNKPCEKRFQNQFKIYDFLGAKDLSKLMAEAKLVVSRSGYSSLMDYYHLGKKALLIPTPGQSEQEYLAKSLSKKGYFHSVSQKQLDLKKDVEKALSFPALKPQELKLPENLFSLFSR